MFKKQALIQRPGFSYRVARFILFVFYKMFFRFRAYGIENVPDPADERGVILAPNHASYLDPPVVAIALRRVVTFLAKGYLFQKFFIGSFLRSAGVVPIKTRTDDFRTIRQILGILKEGHCVAIFPEGTRSVDGAFKKPESGIGFLAMKSQAYVVPVYIQGTYEVLPKGAKWFRPRPVSAYFGRSFIPALEKDCLENPSPYEAVAEKIMREIKRMKERVETKLSC
ncbi:MAG: 1-acyl-sn-glycerol-3-phosphate acyltransferase [Candidatus Omnitrophica bacterium]|nr:1-acyl-sn-glycerol-3-phosphate acyltransferase [Candidatus Omnitrophota bacterium]